MAPQGGANPLCVAPGEGVWWQVTREAGRAGSLFLGLQAVSLAEAPVGIVLGCPRCPLPHAQDPHAVDMLARSLSSLWCQVAFP